MLSKDQPPRKLCEVNGHALNEGNQGIVNCGAAWLPPTQNAGALCLRFHCSKMGMCCHCKEQRLPGHTMPSERFAMWRKGFRFVSTCEVIIIPTARVVRAGCILNEQALRKCFIAHSGCQVPGNKVVQYQEPAAHRRCHLQTYLARGSGMQ
jgi:hypothetical protein